jgi:VanZ family protein
VESAAGLLTRGSLPTAFPACAASGVVVGQRLPSQRRDRPGLAPGSLTVLRWRGRAYHRTVKRPTLGLWLPVVLWAGVIFALSSVPDLSSGLGGWDVVLRKLAHVAEFALLGVLLVRATGSAGAAIAIGVLYAASDEIHQHFVTGRHGAPLDVAIDAVGVLVGVWVARRVVARGVARTPA